MAKKLRQVTPHAIIAASFAAAAYLNFRFHAVPYFNDLYFVPIVLAGYYLSTATAVAVSLLAVVLTLAFGETVTIATILGHSLRSIMFLLVGLLAGALASTLKSQKANLSIQKNRLLSLHRVSSNFLNTLEPVAVIDQLTREARRLLAADSSLLVTYDDGHAYLLAEENLNPDVVPRVLAAIPAVLRKAGGSADPLALSAADVGSDFPFPSMVVAALPGGHYLCVFSSSPRAFTQDELAFLSSFLDEAVIALNGAFFYEAKEKNARVIASIAALNRAAAAMRESSELARIAVEKATDVSGANATLLFLLKKGSLSLAQSLGLDDDARLRIEGFLGRLAGSPDVAQLQSLKEPVVHALSSTEPLTFVDAFTTGVMRTTGARQCVALPLAIKDRVSGLLCLCFASQRRLTNDDLAMLATVADETALVLYNAKLLADMKNLTLKTVESLATALDSTSPYTRNHSRKVAALAVQMAQALKLEPREVREIHFAALLHDFGRIFIPDEIINSPRRLTPEEFAAVRKLPIMSSKIFEPVSFFQAILPVLLHHKERYDGSGYPGGLKGNEIPLGARIVGLAEAYVAMTSERPFRPAMSQREALAEIAANSGTQFDPALVPVLVRVLGVEGAAESAPRAAHIRLVNPQG